jgi:hypothetical protein
LVVARHEGMAIVVSTATIAMTTKSSKSVKPFSRKLCLGTF